MANKKIVLVFNATCDYIRHTGDDEEKYLAQTSRFFEAITYSYIPLLKMFENLERDNISFNVSFVFSPVLCNLLEDEIIQNQYQKWLDKCLEFGKKELEKFSDDNQMLLNAKKCFEKLQSAKEYYEKCSGRLIKRILDFQKKGVIELLGTCATDIFFPFYNDIPEAMGAQIETGLYAYKASFGNVPDGFWLPELGFYPGVDKIIQAYNMNYTILDTKSFLFSKIEPNKGIFAPARTTSSLVVFGRDPFSDEEIFGENGFVKNPVYLNVNRDVGYEYSQSELKPFINSGEVRYPLGYKYWSRADNFYNEDKASVQCRKDAEDFFNKKINLLKEAEKYFDENENVSLVITMSLNKLQKDWDESILWIENILRYAATCNDVSLVHPKNLIENRYKFQKIEPYYSSSNGIGYGEDLLSNKNNWMVRYVRKVSKRMIDLSERFPTDTGLKARLLNLAAKELMLAQSSGWAKMIHNDDFPEYAKMRFRQSINDFTAVFDALGSNIVSTEWLIKLEEEHQIFSWMNYRIFNHKI